MGWASEYIARPQNRGWAKPEGDELHGMIFIHLRDESGFVAERAKAQKRPKRKQQEG
jgi:hypothetical protein